MCTRCRKAERKTDSERERARKIGRERERERERGGQREGEERREKANEGRQLVDNLGTRLPRLYQCLSPIVSSS